MSIHVHVRMYMYMYMYVGIGRVLEESHIINCLSYHRIIINIYYMYVHVQRSSIHHTCTLYIHVHVYFGESTPDEHACTCTLYMYIAEYIHVHCTIQITLYRLQHIICCTLFLFTTVAVHSCKYK